MSLLSTEETERRAQEQVGRTLAGKYHLDTLLGVGGMAAVFAATHRNGNRVAIKLLYPELTRNEDVLTRFIREGYAANRVGHPGAVRVLDDVRDDDGSVFLVMELLEGDPLDVIHASRDFHVAVADVMPWMNQLLDVLAAAHEQGIVHRDIKPENLFLTRGGTLKVLDFGIARMKSAPASTATRTGNQFGTPPFMSPEQALGRMKEIDARSDLYSVGATMFFLLTGQDVHPAESANEQLVLAATKPARSLASVAPNLPVALGLVVDRALTFQRDDRWQDARAMQSALQAAFLEIFGEPIPPLPRIPDSAPSEATSPSGRSMRIKSVNSRASSAETQAVSSAPGVQVSHREHAMTAPPTSTVAQGGTGSRRWLYVALGVLAVGLGVGSYALPVPNIEAAATAPIANVPGAQPPVASASASAAPPVVAATAPPEPPSPAASAPAQRTTAPPAQAASAAPVPTTSPAVRKKPRATPGARPATNSAPAETSAFEHQ